MAEKGQPQSRGWERRQSELLGERIGAAGMERGDPTEAWLAVHYSSTNQHQTLN